MLSNTCLNECPSDNMTSDKISSVVSVDYAPDIHTEEWRKVQDWPYEVSTFGNVRKIGSAHIIKGTRSGPKRNYHIFCLCDGLKNRKWIAKHKVVACAFLGPCPEGMEVDHIDGNPSNNRVDNLRYVTRSENILGSVRRGHRGTNRWNAKLTDDMVRQIRIAKQAGLSAKSIAEHFNLTQSMVYHVARGDNWRHVL